MKANKTKEGSSLREGAHVPHTADVYHHPNPSSSGDQFAVVAEEGKNWCCRKCQTPGGRGRGPSSRGLGASPLEKAVKPYAQILTSGFHHQHDCRKLTHLLNDEVIPESSSVTDLKKNDKSLD